MVYTKMFDISLYLTMMKKVGEDASRSDNLFIHFNKKNIHTHTQEAFQNLVKKVKMYRIKDVSRQHCPSMFYFIRVFLKNVFCLSLEYVLFK